MKAKAKSPHKTIRAFTGLEFVAYEFRPVPDGGEDEAKRLEAGGYLELEAGPPAAAPVAAPVEEPAEEDPKPKASPRSRPKR